MAEEPKVESPIASLGGKARAAKMTPAERKESARKAAEARWGSDLPRAEFAGELDLAGQKIACAVLEDGRRVLSQQSFIEAIGRTGQLKVAARSAGFLTKCDPVGWPGPRVGRLVVDREAAPRPPQAREALLNIPHSGHDGQLFLTDLEDIGLSGCFEGDGAHLLLVPPQ